MRIFIGLCGSVKHGYESSSRGEGRWALSLVRCLKDYGHEIAMAPDTEPCEWGTCKQPSNVLMVQPWEKNRLDKMHFDVAIFTSWQTAKPEAQYIHADKYVWGVMSWKHEIMKDGFFNENEYVARWLRQDLPEIPYPINFKDRCFLLAQPFGKELGASKFSNKRIGWVAKEAFLPSTHPSLGESAARNLFGIIDACKATGAALSIFSAHELDPRNAPKVKELGVWDRLQELKDVRMYPSLPYPEYQRELAKCSVTTPLAFAGSIQEAIFAGIVPMLYKDSGFTNHPWTPGIAQEMTRNKLSRYQSENEKQDVLTSDEIRDILVELLTDRIKYEQYLYRLRPMVVDNIDDHVHQQLQAIMEHKPGRN